MVRLENYASASVDVNCFWAGVKLLVWRRDSAAVERLKCFCEIRSTCCFVESWSHLILTIGSFKHSLGPSHILSAVVSYPNASWIA